MTDYALVTKNSFRATLRTEEGSLLEVTGDPISGGGATGASTSFVYRPGGVAADGVFVTAPALKAGLLTVDPAADKTIVVDASIAAAHLTAADSPWPLDNATFESANGGDLLTLDAGATFTAGTRTLRLRNVVVEVDAGSGAPIWTPTLGAFLEMQDAVVNNPSAVAMVHVNGPGGTFGVILRTANIQSGILAEITPTGAAECVALNGSSVPATSFHSVLGAGGALTLVLDGASQANVSQVQDNANLVVTFTTLDPQPTFVFQPGGVAGGNVFTTWAALMAAAALSLGAKWVEYDNTLGACHITAGTWNIDLFTFSPAFSNGTNRNLIVDVGVVLNFVTVTSYNVAWVNNATATPCIVPNTASQSWRMSSGTLSCGVGAAPMFDCQNGGTLSVTCQVSAQLSTGSGPSIQCDAGGTTVVRLTDFSILQASALTGGGTISVQFADSATVSQTQPGAVGALTFTPKSLATQVAYTPGTAGNWQPAPTLASAALDQLAAPNFVQAQANTGTGTGTTTAVTGNIAKLRSGKVNVSGSVSGIMTAGGTVTVSLLRDATPILALGALTYLATSSYSIPIEFIDTLPDTANHTYTVKAVASAGNLTVPANGNGIVATEM